MSRWITTTTCFSVLGTLLLLAGAVGYQDSQRPELTTDELIATLRESASLGQLATMRGFAEQENAPGALPSLLELLDDEAPRMDNNVCLAVELILVEHPDAVCRLEPLINAVERRIWNSQQKAAQALFRAIHSGRDKQLHERLARALIPLLTSQRSRVFQAGVACLKKLSGEDHPAVPEPWIEWFERRFEQDIDLSDAVYEVLAVVRQTLDEGGAVSYTVNGEAIGNAGALKIHLSSLVEVASRRHTAVAGIVQITEEAMNDIAKTMDFGPVAEPIAIFEQLRISGTVSPNADVFRAPWTAVAPAGGDDPEEQGQDSS